MTMRPLTPIVAAALAFVANKLKQPALLAYLLAGVLIGPEIGFRLITDPEIIEVISEIGLVLLLLIRFRPQGLWTHSSVVENLRNRFSRNRSKELEGSDA